MRRSLLLLILLTPLLGCPVRDQDDDSSTGDGSTSAATTASTGTTAGT